MPPVKTSDVRLYPKYVWTHSLRPGAQWTHSLRPGAQWTHSLRPGAQWTHSLRPGAQWTHSLRPVAQRTHSGRFNECLVRKVIINDYYEYLSNISEITGCKVSLKHGVLIVYRPLINSCKLCVFKILFVAVAREAHCFVVGDIRVYIDIRVYTCTLLGPQFVLLKSRSNMNLTINASISFWRVLETPDFLIFVRKCGIFWIEVNKKF